ncbi:hypothetical protein [Christiangramia sediminis]|uniref:Uncharacterized protein n=1 Tax=Christiangramia sediminis TaxID=2881336 RepID=A0A9X1LGE1_9FLAO|nr:hypothetical protein [Christiangramia sediminis]MCB7479830.1 hypothetical protein [Christiangramia sediminis]
MNKNGLLLYLIILTFIGGYSQEKESYDLKVSYSGMIKNYKIDYHKTDKKIFLVVNKEKSTRKFTKEDRLKLMRLIEVKTSDSKKEIAKIVENYKEYKSDTLAFEHGDLIKEKIDKFVENWDDIKQNLEINPDQRIILDGYMVKLSLEKYHQNYEDIYAHTPTLKSHPRIFELLSDLENYYKKWAENPVID